MMEMETIKLYILLQKPLRTNLTEFMTHTKGLITVGILIVSILLLHIGMASDWFEPQDDNLYPRPSVPVMNTSAEYFPQEEKVKITVESSDEFNRSNTAYLRIVTGRDGRDPGQPAIISGEQISEGGYWVSNNHTAAEEFPVKAGSQVSVLSDGSDNDEDGKEGIDGTENISILFTASSHWKENYRPRDHPIMMVSTINGSAVTGDGSGDVIVTPRAVLERRRQKD